MVESSAAVLSFLRPSTKDSQALRAPANVGASHTSDSRTSATSAPAPELSTAERAEVKKVARALLNRLKQLLVLNWRQKSTARSQIKLTIQNVLDTLPEAYLRPLYAQKCSALFEHIFESYPERDAGVYAAAV